MRIRPWNEVEDFFRKRGLSDDEIFGYKGEYFNRVAAELGKDPEDEELEKQRKLFLYGNDKEWELFKAAKSGLIRGLGEVPETAADIIAWRSASSAIRRDRAADRTRHSADDAASAAAGDA